MFRVSCVSRRSCWRNTEYVKTGLPGMAYVRLDKQQPRLKPGGEVAAMKPTPQDTSPPSPCWNMLVSSLAPPSRCAISVWRSRHGVWLA